MYPLRSVIDHMSKKLSASSGEVMISSYPYPNAACKERLPLKTTTQNYDEVVYIKKYT